MNILDKIFSRELERRTGAHTISIYISANKTRNRRSRSLGSRTVKAFATGTKITTKRAHHSVFYRLNIRFPWLKLVLIPAIGIIAVLDLLGFTVTPTDNTMSYAKIAPMSHHIKITERTLEGKKLVALTFDDGPFPSTTPRLLDVLNEKDVPVTFFMLGSQARNYPDLVQRAEKEHHVVASHTMYHQNLINISAEAAQADISEAKSVFRNILGYEPAYTRPPYGNINGTVTSSVDTPMILWSVDPADWQNKDTDAIVSAVASRVFDGAIILMHDIYPTSVEAIPKLVDTLRESGYEFATIPEIAQSRGISLNSGEAYYGFSP